MEIKITKADDINDMERVPDFTIKIAGNLPVFPYDKTWEDVAEEYYQNEAERLETALYNSLPRATYERLLLALIKRRSLSFYRLSSKHIVKKQGEGDG